MRLLVFGSRSFGRQSDPRNADDVITRLSQRRLMVKILLGIDYDVLIHGGAVGADSLAESISINMKNNIDIVRIPIEEKDWAKHGKAAGPFRNRRLITEGKPDRAIGFIDRIDASSPMSPGSKNMWLQLINCKIPVELYQ